MQNCVKNIILCKKYLIYAQDYNNCMLFWNAAMAKLVDA